MYLILIFLCFYLVVWEDCCNFAAKTKERKDMSYEERKTKMAANRAVNSRKPARSAFMRWARAHKGAFVITDPDMKAQLACFDL